MDYRFFLEKLKLFFRFIEIFEFTVQIPNTSFAAVLFQLNLIIN